ncbi:hypothetical protein PC117_g12634 [Phytophthora cactorum]|uniref:cGMP-dependent protein kinase n=1 Tax=Phytophthora cactorum TaxID=29920 RepID=A0A8T1D3P6_9STRA|nr:hypothetical protein PC117_g12634 [Phytophthora cactorum]
MGGGVSKSEYDRIRKELILKDQVIRTLQERLGDGGYIGPKHAAPGGADGADELLPPERTTMVAKAPNKDRVSVAEPTSGLKREKSGSFSTRFTLLHEAKELLGEGIEQPDSDAKSRYNQGSLDNYDGGAPVNSSSMGKLRRVEVSAEVMPSRKIMSTKERVVYPKGESSRQLLLKILQSNVLFQGQSHGEIRDCLDAFFPMRVEPGHLVIKQGAQGDNFYAVESGQLEILVSMGGAPPIRYGFLGPGLGFGELALLYNMPRAATIRAVTEVELWALERNTFREILASHKLNRLNRTLEVLRKIAILSKLTSSEMQQVAAAMEWEEFGETAAIVRQGEIYALIIQGNVKFPAYMGRASVDLVQKLLCQNPARRLGNMKHGIKDIINHRWFSSFQWDSLKIKSMKPPIVPQVRDDFDTSNFEDLRHEVEDPGHECDWDPDF